MRSLIKNDSGVQYVDGQALQRSRRRRRAVYFLIAASCIGMAGFFLFQLASSADAASGPAISWSDPKSIVTWVRWSFNSIASEIRGAVTGSFPSANLAIVVKLLLCFGLGAIFLRMPQRY